jgi:hypothetical protein
MKGKNRDAWVKAAIALGALLVGLAFGHWSAGPDQEAAKPIVAASSASGDESSLTTKALPPLSERATTENSGKQKSPRPDALARILRERNSIDRLRDITSFVDRLSQQDFAAAMLAAKQLPSGADRDLAMRLLAVRWAEVDPDDALAFAAEHRGFDQVTGEVFQQLATRDLQGALARAEGITDPALHYQAMRGALSVMALDDPAGALKVASSVPKIAHTESLTQTLYRQWSETDPAAAAATAAQDTSDDGWRSPLSQVLRTWASQDPEAALGFAMAMSDSQSQTRSVSDIVRRWSGQDASAAAAWINSIPPGGVRDAAASALASTVASSDVATAVGWAQSIGDANARTTALERVSRRVLWQNPKEGVASLQRAGVPRSILQSLPPPQPGR